MKHKRSLISIAMATLVLVSLCAVCASTSVSAAQGSSANVQSALVGAPVVGAPAMCRQDKTSLDLFIRGANGALYWRHWYAGSWSAWNPLGGKLTSDPAAVASVSGYTGKIDVFGRGTDGALWSKGTTNGGASWTNWYRIGGQLLDGTGPAAYGSIVMGDQRIGWFVTGTNHQLYHMWKDWEGTHDWENLGGYLTSSPAATPCDAGQLDVFGRGRDGALWWRECFSGYGWQSWFSLGGKIAAGTGPAACSAELHVFVQGADGALWSRWGYGGNPSNWLNWYQIGGRLTSSPAATAYGGGAMVGSGDMFVFVRGGDYNLWEQTGWQDNWYGWTGPMAGP